MQRITRDMIERTLDDLVRDLKGSPGELIDPHVQYGSATYGNAYRLVDREKGYSLSLGYTKREAYEALQYMTAGVALVRSGL